MFQIPGYEMPHVSMYNMYGSEPYAEGTFGTQGGRSYTLRLCFGKFYPDEMPTLLVVSPKYLYTYDGKMLNGSAWSHSYHHRGINSHGYLEICHTALSDWSPSLTAVACFYKGITWITALEASLIGKKPLCDFVGA